MDLLTKRTVRGKEEEWVEGEGEGGGRVRGEEGEEGG